MQTAIDAAIIGMGYVGLPLAQQATLSGLSVVGVDTNAHTVAHLSEGKSHIDDLSDSQIKAMLAAGFTATTDSTCLSQAGTIVICVPTPLAEDGSPDLTFVLAAAATIRNQIRPGQTIVLESTTYPGTTKDLLLPFFEETGMVAGKDFHLAFSPERIDPGNSSFGPKNTPKIVGGVTQSCGDAAEMFYERFIDVVVRTRTSTEAEMAKLLENTYRQINIALVNEMVKFCHELNIDLWDSIAAASTKPFGFEAFRPGPGVGGHCIPIDPSYLSHNVRTRLGYPFRFVELAQEINKGMPSYVVHRLQDLLNQHEKPLSTAKILLLGITYKPDIADQRESPAIPIALRLNDMGATVQFHDPFITEWSPDGVHVERCLDLQELGEFDVVVLLQPHHQYDVPAIASRSQLFFDTRGCTSTELPNTERL